MKLCVEMLLGGLFDISSNIFEIQQFGVLATFILCLDFAFGINGVNMRTQTTLGELFSDYECP